MPTTTIMQTKAPINVSKITDFLILQEYVSFCRFASAAEMTPLPGKTTLKKPSLIRIVQIFPIGTISESQFLKKKVKKKLKLIYLTMICLFDNWNKKILQQ